MDVSGEWLMRLAYKKTSANLIEFGKTSQIVSCKKSIKIKSPYADLAGKVSILSSERP
jgi:hypothetical protein